MDVTASQFTRNSNGRPTTFSAQQTKKNAKFLITDLLWGEPPVARGFPSQRVSNVDAKNKE